MARIETAIDRRERLQHVALNVAKFEHLQTDLELWRDVAGSDLVGVDGQGIILGARAFGIAIPERVTGVDVMEAVLARAAERGWRPYFLGAAPEVLERAIAATLERHPALRFAGSRHGYFKPEEEAAVIADIATAGADCLFIGMPTPRKERFLARHRDALGVPFIMGVGGGLDVLAGHVRCSVIGKVMADLAAERRSRSHEVGFCKCNAPCRIWRRDAARRRASASGRRRSAMKTPRQGWRSSTA